MNLLAPIAKALGFKAAGTVGSDGRLPMPGQGGNGVWWGNLRFGGWDNRRPDFDRIIGNAIDNSAVWACVDWIVKAWPQATPTVVAGVGEAQQVVEEHPLPQLLMQPSAEYDGRLLQQALLFDWYGVGRGNAYAYVVRLNDGEPVGLQYLPASCMKPRRGNGEIEYVYRCDGKEIVLRPSEGNFVLHFRNGIDPNNMLLGRDPLAAVQAEIATDNVVSEYQYKLLANGAVPPYVLGPDGKDTDGVIAAFGEEEAQLVKQKVMENAQAGKPVVMTGGFKLQLTGISPKDLVLGELQNKSEERIAAVIGIPPIVPGLGAGLERSTYNNTEAALEAAWENCVIPLQDAFASECTRVLIPLFDGPGSGNRVAYDRGSIRALQQDRNEEAETAWNLYERGIISLARAKSRVGEVPDPGDEEIYFTRQAEPEPTPEAAKGVYPLPFVEAPRDGALFKNVGPVSDSSELDAALKRFRRDLQRREVSAVSPVQDGLDVAEKAILDALDALLADIEALPDDQPVSEAWLLRQELYIALLTQIEQEHQALAASVAPNLTEVQAGYVNAAVNASETLTRAALGPEPDGVSLQWNRLPTATLTNLIGFATDGSPLKTLFEELGPDLSKQVQEALIAGVAQGKNPRQTAQAMRSGVDAKLGLSRARAEAIARTETLRAAREASRQSYEANSDVLEGWIWTATRDSRTCASCWAMHGSKHGLSEILDDHVNGRCVAVPAVKSWAEIVGDPTLPDTRPAIESGPAVFAKLPAQTQLTVLGAALYELFASGAIELSDCTVQEYDPRWGTQRRAATVAEAQANAARRVAA